MEINIAVRARGQLWSGGVSVDIAEPFVFAWETLKMCDDSLMAPITGEVMPTSIEAKKILKFRKETAKELAEEITRLLVCDMYKHDTLNGYKVVRDE